MNIPNCPFFFNVIKEMNKNFLNDYSKGNNLNATLVSPTTNNFESVMKTEPVENITGFQTLDNNKSQERLNNNNNSVNGSTVSLCGSRPLSAGRGRLFKQIINEQANKVRSVASSGQQQNAPEFCLNSNKSSAQQQRQQSNSTLNINDPNKAQSQKRKSPLINFFDEQEVMDADVELCEISTKLKKVVVDEANNQYYQYNNSANAQQDFDFSRLRINKPLNSGGSSTAYLDNHLRKHASQKFGDIPPLKAVFQRKYSANMSFPIGVAVCNLHNWVLVADNGNNSVKVFERTGGELIYELKGDPKCGAVPFKRPSALLINTKDAELYVKDDIQIQVFDIENNFNFKRRFGVNLLKRPYGLATNSKEDIICVDADLRQPLIHTFDKSGQLLSSKSYQPIVKDLASTFNYPNISKKVEPFEKTKIRFICVSQNSLYSSDLGRSIIFKTTLDGEILFAFGHHGKHKGELNEPSGIFVDQNGTILVGDSKNARLQVSNSKIKMESILTLFFFLDI